jgi:N6-L-threonylcarbamoyladenine synthase
VLILSIETSCDDTGVALLGVKNGQIKVLADFVSSQNDIHAPYGGVVPNLAVRAHYKNLPILLESVLKKTDSKKVDLIAVTNGPGLEPCLWAGVRIARVLAEAMNKPIVGVNHLEGHIAANFIGGIPNFEFRMSKQIKNSHPTGGHPKGENFKFQISNFPIVCLIVSGGHTQIVLIKDIGKYKIIGQTRDDAAGEAFDKVAKILDLGYPGGPRISEYAKAGDKNSFKFPRPMADSSDFDFSFSGLKTAVLYAVKNAVSNSSGSVNEKNDNNPAPGAKSAFNRGLRPNTAILKGKEYDKIRHDVCAAFQQAAVDVLISKTIKAAVKYKAKAVMLSGGVSANNELREQMRKAVEKNLPFAICHSPSARYCTDNAVMIGLAGYWKFMRQGKGDKIEKIVAEANLNL